MIVGIQDIGINEIKKNVYLAGDSAQRRQCEGTDGSLSPLLRRRSAGGTQSLWHGDRSAQRQKLCPGRENRTEGLGCKGACGELKFAERIRQRHRKSLPDHLQMIM